MGNYTISQTFQPELEARIKKLLRTYYDIQKLRIAVGNRIAVTEFTECPNKHVIPLKRELRNKGVSETECPLCGAKAKVIKVDAPEVLKTIAGELEKLEAKIYRELSNLVKDHILWREYLSMVKGVGPAMAAYLISVLNPAKFETVSKMWKYCGLHVVCVEVPDNRTEYPSVRRICHAPRRVEGEKAGYSPEARTMMWRLGESFRKVGGVYRWFFEQFYQDSVKKHPDWTKAHIIADARRRTVKLFLAHYHWVGRILLNLPVKLPYPCMFHECIPPLVDFDEAEIAKEPLIDVFYEKFVKPMDISKEVYMQLVRAYEDWKQMSEKIKRSRRNSKTD